MNPLYSELQWCPRARRDFPERLEGLANLSGPVGNKLVVDHYAKLGFKKVGEDASRATRWELLVDGAKTEHVPMKVVSQGFAPPNTSAIPV